MRPARLQYEILLKHEKENDLSLLLHLGDVPTATRQVMELTERTWA